MSEPEWTPWGPDSPGYPECPVSPGTDCEVRFRDEDTERHENPEVWGWTHRFGRYDIIAYRVWCAKDDAENRLAEALAVIAYEQPAEPWKVAHDALKGTARPLGTAPAKEAQDDARALLVEARDVICSLGGGNLTCTLARIDAYLDRQP